MQPQSTVDRIDAFPLSAHDERRDHTGMPIDAVVAVTSLHLSFDNVFMLVLMMTVTQAIFAAIVLLVLLAIGVL